MKQVISTSNCEYWKRQVELDDAELLTIQNTIRKSAVLLARLRIDALADIDFPIRDEMFKIGTGLCRDYLKIQCYRKVYEKHCKAEIGANTAIRSWIKLVKSEATIKCAEAMFVAILAENSKYARKRRSAKRDSVALALKRAKGEIKN